MGIRCPDGIRLLYDDTPLDTNENSIFISLYCYLDSNPNISVCIQCLQSYSTGLLAYLLYILMHPTVMGNSTEFRSSLHNYSRFNIFYLLIQGILALYIFSLAYLSSTIHTHINLIKSNSTHQLITNLPQP